MKKIINSLRPTERLIFLVFSVLFVLSSLYLLDTLNKKYSVERPVQGGSYTEGVVGFARFINPVLSYTDADRDMVALLYSGLLIPSTDGELTGNIAESWEMSDDGLEYTFNIKDDLTFHDGTPLTTDDIEFTIEKMRDPLIKSPKIDIWNGVKVEKISITQIKFILQKPYAPFLENLTFGILPLHLWKDIDAQIFDVHSLNREPVGSGPFMIKKTFKDSEGIYQHYDLAPFKSYALGQAYIKNFRVKFYKNEQEAFDAYKDGSIDALGGVTADLAESIKNDNKTFIESPLPRIFALFFNQNKSTVLLNREVRQALNVSANRVDIINDVLSGWGTPESGPVPFALSSEDGMTSNSDQLQQSKSLIEEGRQILIAKGWKIGEDGVFEKEITSGKSKSIQKLSFSISTSDVPELKRSAEMLKETWTKLGADVTLEIFEPSDLTQRVIRPREYQALLFGNIIGRDLDLYPFWHSSERNDPGLNISLYTNIKADKALETLRSTSDEAKIIEARKIFQTEVQNDIPAVFLFSPNYIYATNGNVKNIKLSKMTSVSERFSNVHQWYTETERVWKMFAEQTQQN